MKMHGSTFGRILALLAALAAGAPCAAESWLQPYADASSAPASPWVVLGLPHQSKPFTRFSVVDLDGKRALRMEANKSYGNLVHPLKRTVTTAHLAWQWRVDEPLKDTDLHEKAGEDIAAKVCTAWDLPIESISFAERQTLRIARAASDVELPGATVCYVWDPVLAPDTQLESPYTRRVRYIVLRGPADPLRRWTAERRDIVADFFALFGDEAKKTLPPLIGVLVGADADNTRQHSVADVADIVLEP
jgi:hypothetical protein